MKHIFLKGTLLVFLFFMMGACNTEKDQHAKVVDKEQIKREIQERENEFAEIYNSGELRRKIEIFGIGFDGKYKYHLIYNQRNFCIKGWRSSVGNWLLHGG